MTTAPSPQGTLWRRHFPAVYSSVVTECRPACHRPTSRSKPHCRLLVAAGLCLLWTLPLSSAELADLGDDPAVEAETAVEAGEEMETAAEGEAADEFAIFEVTRQSLHGSAYWLVKNVDSWFGDKPFADGGRVEGALRMRLIYREDDGFESDIRYRLRAQTPNIDERSYVFLGRDNERDLIRDEGEGFRRGEGVLPESTSEEQTFFAGIGLLLRENVDLRLGVRGGYKVYAQARYRRTWWLTEASNIEYRQTLFLAVQDGFGTRTGLNFAYALNPRTAFRWRNSATVSTETNGVEWSTSLGLFQAFAGQRQLSLEVLASGETDDPVPVREYGLRGILSRPIYRDWVIGELITGYYWPRDDDDPERREAWALGLGIEVRF